MGLVEEPRLGLLTSRGQEAVRGPPQESDRWTGPSTLEATPVTAVSQELDELSLHTELAPGTISAQRFCSHFHSLEGLAGNNGHLQGEQPCGSQSGAACPRSAQTESCVA